MRSPTRSRAGSAILLRTITRNARRLTLGSVLICLFNGYEALVPILVGFLIDRVIAGGDVLFLLLGIGALGLLILVQGINYRLGARQLMLAIAEEGHLLRGEVTAKVLDPRGIRTDRRTGELLSVSTNDTDQTSYVLDYVPRVAGSVTMAVIGAVTLLVIDVPLGLAVLIGTPVVLLVLQFSSPLITKRVAVQQERAGEATALATDLVSGLRPLRGIRAEEAARRRYHVVSRHSLDAAVHAARTQGAYKAASSTLSALLACGIALLACWFALRGRISVGECIIVIGMAQVLIEPFSLLAIIPSWVAEARASADRVASVLSSPVLLPSSGACFGGAGLTLDSLEYASLRGLDLTVRPGEFLGVVAQQAEDGDALGRVLAVRVGPSDYAGSVSLDGQRLDAIEARGVVLVEPHHTDLFSGTLRDNLLPDGCSRELAGALVASAADQVVSLHGLEHQVTERGASLSGGQRQRIALARALLAEPPILVLRDPTTAVDAVTEHAIAQGIREFRRDLTTVVITSSPVLLAAADRVVLLDGGRVVAEGTPGELVATSEDYRRAVLR
ncbi:ABC transporter permease [Lentzea sp. NBRC 105346]|uniref:ABC transporter ATP-binding protein n=1 Tax=Lentzea sp. NBRC 105346 TaxID=3032205 RepID=UPI0024A0C4DB|nr:ABC transporter ATP-binding protein [Lentzea sp. NBRC 105346]GLZ35225.1 ABC transporter permease [Lentzea sp. NBRC 105346]